MTYTALIFWCEWVSWAGRGVIEVVCRPQLRRTAELRGTVQEARLPLFLSSVGGGHRLAFYLLRPHLQQGFCKKVFKESVKLTSTQKQLASRLQEHIFKHFFPKSS